LREELKRAKCLLVAVPHIKRSSGAQAAQPLKTPDDIGAMTWRAVVSDEDET
jgi:hypothetical protein